MRAARLLDRERVKHIHFVGIGGIGLSAIARVLLADGYVISGSDVQSGSNAEALAEMGVTFHKGHRGENVRDANLVVVSSAIKDDNAEVLAARAAGIPVVKRDAILGEMMARKTAIAVAGTHGKTTTSAWIAFVLEKLGLDPTFIVGGILQDLGTNARRGSSEFFVIEADEYDHMFLGLRPTIEVVTVIELDHPDCYPNIEMMEDAFRRFIGLLPAGGTLIGCADQTRVLRLLDEGGQSPKVHRVTYGLDSGDWRAEDICANHLGGSDFRISLKGTAVGACSIAIPGRHNVSNCLAVLAVAQSLGLDLERVLECLPQFHGVRRRFEVKGEAAGVTVVDDYAHHPTEVRATLAAARQRFGTRSIWVFFQPHTYSRTKALLSELATSFDAADHVLVGEVYAARERDTLGVSGRHIVECMGHRDARFVASLEEATRLLCEELKPGDVLVTLGAGDGYLVGEQVIAHSCAARERGPVES